MKISNKTTVVAMAMLIIIVTIFAPATQASPTETTAKDSLKSFLTDVVGLDLTKYNISKSGYGVSYPSNLGGIVKEETVSFSFDSGQSKADSWCIFDNGIMTSCSFALTQGSVIYAQSRPNNANEEAGNIIQRYQTFATQHNVTDTTYLQQARSILDEANSQRTTTMTSANMKIEIAPSPEYTNIKWIYSTNGIDMPFKSIALSFRNNDFCWFGDGWSLYSVGNIASISKDEAASMGFAAAKNYTVHLAKFDGNTVTSVDVKPQWSNVTYEATLNMIPGASMNMSLPTVPSAPSIPSYVIPSKTIRDPLALYPMWQFIFYFDKPIGSVSGVQLGVWGDTKELAYCSEYGSLGGPGTTSEPTSGQSSNGEAQSSFLTSLKPEYTYAMVFVFAVAIVLGSYVAIKRKRS